MLLHEEEKLADNPVSVGLGGRQVDGTTRMWEHINLGDGIYTRSRGGPGRMLSTLCTIKGGRSRSRKQETRAVLVEG